jgi:hypothetical protein
MNWLKLIVVYFQKNPQLGASDTSFQGPTNDATPHQHANSTADDATKCSFHDSNDGEYEQNASGDSAIEPPEYAPAAQTVK